MRGSLLLLLVLCSFSLSAQKDVISWSSVQLDYKANDKLTLKLKPITRTKDNISAYADTSIDFIISYKLSKGWSASILERHFFIPDQPDVEFLFFDIKKTFNKEKLQFNNYLRYHLIKGDTRDFIRYQPSVGLRNLGKWTPFVAAELWFNTTLSSLVGGRYSAGVKYQLSKQLGIHLTYWNQEGYSDAPIGEHHNFLFNLHYLIPRTNKMEKTTPSMSK